jgi:hypothetical protein
VGGTPVLVVVGIHLRRATENSENITEASVVEMKLTIMLVRHGEPLGEQSRTGLIRPNPRGVVVMVVLEINSGRIF